MTRRIAIPILALLLPLAGCAKKPPPVVEAGGRVLLNGAPLAKATVQFMPELKDFGAEMNSTAVTDENGAFSLTCALGNQPGAAVATHRVLVVDTTPDEMRGQDSRSQEAAGRYQAALKNRPIPAIYASYTSTPLRVTVEAGKKTYDLELKR